METMSRALLVVLFISVMVAGAYAGGIKDGTLSAYSNGSSIVVRWISDDERDVRGYMVERRAGVDGQFIQLTDPVLVPRGNGSSYEYIDDAVFRTNDNLYQYRITCVGNGVTYDVTVNHRVSSVRRTWGSIKAMFR
jgi:hypothetical protein